MRPVCKKGGTPLAQPLAEVLQSCLTAYPQTTGHIPHRTSFGHEKKVMRECIAKKATPRTADASSTLGPFFNAIFSSFICFLYEMIYTNFLHFKGVYSEPARMAILTSEVLPSACINLVDR